MTFNIASDAAMEQGTRRQGSEVLTLCLASGLTSAIWSGVPLWVSDLIRLGILSPQKVGWLTTAELLLAALGTFGTVMVMRRWRPRNLLRSAGIALFTANFLAITGGLPGLILGRLANGVAMGIVLAVCSSKAATAPNAQKALALQAASAAFLAAGVYLIAPLLESRFGVMGIFGLFSAIGLAVSLSVQLLPLHEWAAAKPVSSHESKSAMGGNRLPTIIACLAIALTLLGFQTVWNYSVAIGVINGINRSVVVATLSMVPIFGFLGPIAAHAFGERAGKVPPLIFGFGLAAVAVALLPLAGTPLLLAILCACMAFPLTFGGPYASAIVAAMDPSGRAAGTIPAMSMIGAAMGAGIGGQFFESNVTRLCLIGAGILMTGMLTLAVTARVARIR